METIAKRSADILARIAAIGACCILVAMVAFILYEIILRSGFHSSTYVLDEFIGYGIATMTFLSFAAALKDKALIRVNLILSVTGPGTRRALEVASHALGALLFSYIALYFWKFVSRDYSRGTVSNSVAQVPLWIPEALMLTGLIVLILQFMVLTVHYARGAPIIDIQDEL